MRDWTAVFAVVALVFSAAPATQNVDTLKVPTFGQVAVYRPASTPSQAVLFISGDGGWNLGVVSMAERLRDLGALVVGLDVRTFLKSLCHSSACSDLFRCLEWCSSRSLRLPRSTSSPRKSPRGGSIEAWRKEYPLTMLVALLTLLVWSFVPPARGSHTLARLGPSLVQVPIADAKAAIEAHL